jgi:uncharacterized membrane protein YeaQ/YmgE (transglycosylase-associated protein family)
MVLFADLSMTPGGILAWLVVGLVAGWLAGLFMRGTGFGVLGDVLVGLAGAFVGGAAFSLVTNGSLGFWGSLGVAFVGACLFVAILRAVVGRSVT